VVAGFNVIVFTVITILAHREKSQKKRDGQLRAAPASLNSSTPDIEDGNEKKLTLVGEEDITPAVIR
jgi:ACS family pantothenate transporter-like MFS transporter